MTNMFPDAVFVVGGAKDYKNEAFHGEMLSSTGMNGQQLQILEP